ncbi:hypothetical protein MASR1M90_18400 [Desulfovibrionales bacterium]
MTRIARFAFCFFLAVLHNLWMLLVFLTTTSILLLANHYWDTLVACHDACARFVLQFVSFIQNL